MGIMERGLGRLLLLCAAMLGGAVSPGVAIGANVTVSVSQSCAIWDTSRTSNYGSCDNPNLSGWAVGNEQSERGGLTSAALLKFGSLTSAIPVGDRVASARLRLRLGMWSPSAVGRFEVLRTMQPWDGAATWFRATAAESWPRLGGDGEIIPEATIRTPHNGVVELDVTSGVRAWQARRAAGSTIEPPLGFLLRMAGIPDHAVGPPYCDWETGENCRVNEVAYVASPSTPFTAERPSLAVVTESASGRPPLLKRTDMGDTLDLQRAMSGWESRLPGNYVRGWYTTRFDSVVLHDGPDWATAWAPRNWHHNAWVYRKAMAYQANRGVHSARPELFVYLDRPGRPLASINYLCERDCGGNRVDQPVLNVTRPEARTFWLRGPDGKVDGLDADAPSYSNCQSQHVTDHGVLDLLACRVGSHSGPQHSANFKGVWLDDLLLELSTPTGIASYPSHLSVFPDGTAVTNGELGQLRSWQGIGFSAITSDQWAAGLHDLVKELRRGIVQLRAAGVLAPDRGVVAANLKWSSYGHYRDSTPRPIAPESVLGRTIRQLDLVELEHGWIDSGLTAANTSEWSFRRKQDFVRAVHALGVNVAEEKTSSGDLGLTNCLQAFDGPTGIPPSQTVAHLRTAEYNFASTMLLWTPGDWVGDMCERVDQGWRGYQTDLGVPLGAAQYLSNGLQQRVFASGRVIVAPPGASGTVSLPHTMYTRSRDPYQSVQSRSGSISLGQRDAAVLLNSPPAG